MSRDAKLIIASNAFRNFGFGVLNILFVLYLTELGFDPVRIGALIGATLFGSAMLNLVVGSLAERVGRRRMMAVSTSLMIVSGLVLILSRNQVVLFLAALTGALNVAGISSSAFVSLDQAILPQLSQPGTRNRNFGIYNAVALVGRITGSLASGTSSAMHSMAGFALVDAYRLVLGCFVGSAAISLTCILALSVEIESQPDGRSASHGAFHLVSSRKHVLRMSLLFCIDSFSSGLVNSSMVVLLFHQRFGVGAEVLGPTYSAARVLQGISYMVAAKLADRSGLLNTMVFTHLPSQLLLMALPFAPTLPIGIVILLVRQGLAHMDLPTRQAYLAAIVQPEERTSAASITNLARNLAQSISPTLSGFAYQVFLYTAPFLMAGLLGILYDVGLYLRFRKVVPEREELAMALGAPEITFHRD